MAVNIPNSPFNQGDDWTPELADLAFAQVFDDQTQLKGHHERVKDDELSNASTAIKARVAKLVDGLKVEQGPVGLFIKYNEGTVQTLDDTDVAIPTGILGVPDNTSNILVFIDAVGVVNVSTSANISRQLLARVNTAGGIITSITDLRDRAKLKVMPRANAIQTFGGNSVQDYNQTSGTATLVGEQRFRNFNLGSGATLNIPSALKLYCSGNVTISGTIIVNPPIDGGVRFFGVYYAATYPSSRALGLGGGHGNTADSSAPYHYSLSSAGSGGGAGFLTIRTGSVDETIFILSTQGGKGGGLVQIEAAGNIFIEGAINCNGGNGEAASLQSPSNAYIINPGAGGGSGGLIHLKSLRSIITSATATLSAKGGNGGPVFAQSMPHQPAGGGGGGGGYIVLHSPNNNTTEGVVTTAGGIGGANFSAAPVNIGGSVGGSFGGKGGSVAAGPGGIGQFISITGQPV